jgi:DNA repair protein RadC
MEKKALHKDDGHRQRLRDRFLKSGLSGFHDYEVIELLLTLGTPRKDCKQAAKEALRTFKNLPAVLEASPSQLSNVKGIGPKSLIGLKLVKAVADRYLETKVINKDPINNSKELYDFLFHRFRGIKRECFHVLFMDAKNKIIASETLFEGTLTASSVYPREVVKMALERHAAALILVHNHPSGDPQPSTDDMAITQQLLAACELMGITIHEHIVIGDNRYYSFADKGDMKRFKRELAAK